MNIWIISAIIVGVLLLGGLVLIANTQIAQADVGEEKSCGYSSGSECPYSGKCNADRNCGLSGCGAAKTGSCGCGG